MFLIDTPNSVNGFFVPPNPYTKSRGTVIGYQWLNTIQLEIASVCAAAGIPLNKASTNQLLLAIQQLIAAAGSGGPGGDTFGANANLTGIGVFDAKVGNTLQFRGIGGHADGSIAVALDVANKAILLQAVGATGVQRGTIQLAGQLGGTAALPTVTGMRETGGPTNLAYGAVADGQYLRRSGATIVGDSSTVPDADAGTKGKVQLAGHLGGAAAAPLVTGMRETAGPTNLTYGAVADGQFLKRVGASVVGDSGTVPDADAATKGKVQLAGHLGGTAAAPKVTGLRETAGPTDLALGAVADGQFLKRVGATVVGDAGTVPDADATTKGKVQLAGHLGGAAAAPKVTGMRETAGPTDLSLGAVADGQYLKRVGATVVGDSAAVPDADGATKGKVQLAGHLGGAAALPTVTGMRETAGPTNLAYGAVADGQFLRRVGATVVGATPTGTGDVTGPAGSTVADELVGYADTTGKVVKKTNIALLPGPATGLLQVPTAAQRPPAIDRQEAVAIPTFGDQLAQYGFPGKFNTLGQCTTFNDSSGRWLRCNTLAVIGSRSGVVAPLFEWYRCDNNLDLHVRFRSQQVANIQLWIGFFNFDPNGVTSPINQQIAALRWDTAADAEVKSYTCAGAAPTEVLPTGLTLVAGTIYDLRVVGDYSTPGAEKVRFYNGNTLIATNAVTFPTAAGLVSPVVSCRTLDAGIKQFYFGRLSQRQI